MLYFLLWPLSSIVDFSFTRGLFELFVFGTKIQRSILGLISN